MNMLKALLRSRTIQGIIAAALGASVNYIRGQVSDDLLPIVNDTVAYGAGLLQAAGLGWATYGRVKAEGPIEAGGKNDFDGTGGDLPR